MNHTSGISGPSKGKNGGSAHTAGSVGSKKKKKGGGWDPKKHMHLENLRPWKPGQSGNPGGRPAKSALDYAIEQLLAEPVKKFGNPERTKARKLAKAAMEYALRGNYRMLQLLAERSGGKPLQPIDVQAQVINDLGPDERKARIKELLRKENLRKLITRDAK